MKFCTRIFILPFLLLISFTVTAQQLWSVAKDDHSSYFANKSAGIPSKYKLMDLNINKLLQVQPQIPLMQGEQAVNGVPFELPLADGKILSTSIIESPLWADRSISEGLGLRTYMLVNPVTKALEGRIVISKNTINGIVFYGQESVYIEPLEEAQTSTHMIYFHKDGPVDPGGVIPCKVEDHKDVAAEFDLQAKTDAGDCIKRTYLVAIAATAEYTNWAGGVPQAQTAITNTMNIVAAIYQRDLNVFFSMVDNTSVIFTNTVTDPYSGVSPWGVSSTTLNENQGALGALTYDVGMVFHNGYGGGIAQLNAVCNASGKGRGATGASPPNSIWFRGAVAHEFGHMFSATHAFSSNDATCGPNISLSTAWEPAGGSTIMAYAGACDFSPVTNQDHYFHAGSIAQMQNYITGTGPGNNGSCAVTSISGNLPPVITSPVELTSYTIPISTPFMLRLTATDANAGDVLNYSWEQMNGGLAMAGVPSSTQTQGASFRSFPHSTNPLRYFPMIEAILEYPFTTSPFEVLPSVTRTMNFRGTVRDMSSLGGCTAETNVVVNSNSIAGPFTVTSQGDGFPWVYNGTNTATITWNVANTTAVPVSCANVDIFLSLDGGYTYPISLATATPNDGSHIVTVPNVITDNARVMVKGSGNIFFNVNSTSFAIQNPLPVTFLGLTAVKEDAMVKLNWSTATEINSDKFIVQRSSNGTEFTSELATVKAAGFSNTVKKYESVDKVPLSKWNYYRIKEVDFDGKITYSNIAAVYAGEKQGVSASVYPNPFKNSVSVNVFNSKTQTMNFDITDIQGRLISRKRINVPEGESKHSFDLESHSAGVYILKIHAEGNTYAVLKLIKE